jgi:hypothetical protein
LAKFTRSKAGDYGKDAPSTQELGYRKMRDEEKGGAHDTGDIADGAEAVNTSGSQACGWAFASPAMYDDGAPGGEAGDRQKKEGKCGDGERQIERFAMGVEKRE